MISDSHNPHAHVMLTLRTVSPNGFGNKQREWNNRENIEAWRVNWEIIANDRLKKYGHKSRIDSRSLKDQKEEAERKAVFAKTPKEKAKWISKIIELDRTPMTRIHRHQWRKGQKLRAMEQKEKALLLKIANVTYLQQTKTPQPEETMKIEKKPLTRAIIDNLKALYKKTQHIFKSKPNVNKNKKEEKEDPQNFVSSYVINEFGEHILKTELETKPKTGTGTGGNNGGGKMGSGSGMSPMNQPQPKIEEPEPEPMPEFEDQQPKSKKKFGM
ncbi:MobA/MobL family protein [Enterobacter roggenkampii]